VLATESEPCVLKIVNSVELILQDGLKPRSSSHIKNINLNVHNFSLRQVTELVSSGINKVMGPVSQDQPVFWHFVRNHLTRHEQDRYYHLQNVGTDYGRGRSWLRSSINEHSLDRYLKMLFSDESLLCNFYEPSALINASSARECLLQSAKDLRSVIFALIVDRKELDHCEELKQFFAQSLQPAPEAILPVMANEQIKRPKKSKVRVVDLDCEATEAVESLKSIAISIPQSGHEMPSLELDHVGSEQSIDSQTDLKHSTLTLPEMKQLLLELTEKKNQLEDEKSCLEVRLGEVEHENRQVANKLKTAENHTVELDKENAILREQLKQYMSVVQMIKNSDTKHATPPPDYLHEVNHFEDKLVQVAEMHGELMEFNSHLQCRLQAADLLLQRFRTELVHLRGSLSSDYIRNEDGSNVNNESIMDYPLIHIWIPSTFLVHEQGHSHHVYQIYIRLGDTEWTVFKRYSQMYKFRNEVRERFPFASDLHFPPKKNFGKRHAKTVEERRRKLQDFLRHFLNMWTQNQNQNSLTKTNLIDLLPFFGEP